MIPQPAPDPDPAGLRRELGLRDLTLFAVSVIVSTRWLVAAGQAGPGAILLWLLGALLFVLPLAHAVATLTVRYPGTGGLYLWARNDFGPWHGFLCFWVYWMGIAFWFPGAALFYLSAALHALGPSWANLASDQTTLVLLSMSVLWVALGTNLVGLRIGKWTENLGAAAAWLLSVVLLLGAWISYRQAGSATPLDHVIPAWNWSTVNVWASIAYAMSGLELAGLIGGEIRNPEVTLPRAGWIASIFITLFYTCSTLSLIVLVPSGKLDPLYGLAQGGDAAARATGSAWIAPVVAALALLSALGQFGGIGTSVSRLPFVVSADGLLPAAFARVHPRWATPHVSLLTLGAVASVLLIAMQVGDTLRVAYQEIVSLMIIAGFLPYLYIFSSAWRAGKRLSAISGLAVTCIALLCAVIPGGDVTNVWIYEGKLLAGTIAVIGSAAAVYRHMARRSF